MNEIDNKYSFFNNIKLYILNNLRYFIILISILIIFLISFQIYNYLSIQNLKKTSVNFFNIIESNEDIINDLNDISKNKNIFSILSKLKIIEKNNEMNNFAISNEIYRDLVLSDKIDSLYKSSIAIHASYTLINASYIEETKNYLNDINFYINNISDEFENYFSIKEELKYLSIITEVDLNKTDYKNNPEVLELYNNISNSNLISSSVKERVKKIHEFKIYK